jgi:thioredoxin 1
MQKINKLLLNEVLSNKKDTFLYFYNESCGNCKLVTPSLEKLSRTDTKYQYYKVNTIEEPTLSEKYNIEYVPTIILLHEGKEVQRAVGIKDFNNLK